MLAGVTHETAPYLTRSIAMAEKILLRMTCVSMIRTRCLEVIHRAREIDSNNGEKLAHDEDVLYDQGGDDLEAAPTGA